MITGQPFRGVLYKLLGLAGQAREILGNSRGGQHPQVRVTPDLTIPPGQEYADRGPVSPALPLLWLGIAGNSLPAGIFKKSLARALPFSRLGNDRAIRALGMDDDARESFYSGHASRAFFSAAFTDPVIAEIVRRDWPGHGLGSKSPLELRFLRIAQGALSCGLTTTVARSRIDIDRHYMSDVLAGGLLGTIHGVLLYRLDYAGHHTGRRLMVTAMQGGRRLEVA